MMQRDSELKDMHYKVPGRVERGNADSEDKVTKSLNPCKEYVTFHKYQK